MAKKIRFPLEMKDGIEVRDMEGLRENFSLERVLFYLADGKLETWLRDRYLDEVADAVMALDREDVSFNRRLCEIFEVGYDGEEEADLESAVERKRKLELLSEYTDDEHFTQVVDQIAFDQDDLYDLLDEGENVIYLCGERFSIPLGKQGISYIGVNNPTVVISSKDKVDFAEKNISFNNVRFDEKYLKIISMGEPQSDKSENHGMPGREEQKDCTLAECDCSEEVRGQLDNLINDLTECLDSFLEEMQGNYGYVYVIENSDISLSSSYYDDGNYVWETKAKARVACKEAIQDFITSLQDEYFYYRDEVLEDCKSYMENIENDVMEFIDKFIDSFHDLISLDCEGDAESYAQNGMEHIANKSKMIKQFKDLKAMENIETYAEELFNKPLSAKVNVKEYLDMCTYDYDGDDYCYEISDAVNSLVDNITELYESACKEMDERMIRLFKTVLEKYCTDLKKELPIMYREPKEELEDNFATVNTFFGRARVRTWKA